MSKSINYYKLYILNIFVYTIPFSFFFLSFFLILDIYITYSYAIFSITSFITFLFIIFFSFKIYLFILKFTFCLISFVNKIHYIKNVQENIIDDPNCIYIYMPLALNIINHNIYIYIYKFLIDKGCLRSTLSLRYLHLAC